MTASAPDAIIIGAGIVGAAAAYYLTADGLSVLVLEAGFPSCGATAGGMGHIVVMDDSAAQLALTSWSRRLLAELMPELPAQCEIDACGTLWIAEDEAQLEAARLRNERYSRAGVRSEVLDAQAIREAEPELRRGLAGALRVVDDVVLYPPVLSRWLLERAADAGARVRPNTRAARIEAGSQPAVRCESGERMEAGLVINAAGAAAPRLTPGLDIVPRKGHLVITDRYPEFCRHQLVELGYLQSAHSMTDVSVAFNLQPRPTGQLLIGSSRELVGWDARVNRDVLGAMLRRAVSFVPRLAQLSAIRTWTAFRPATPDHLPYIGPSNHEGVWIAAGHEGLGITTALGTGRLLADLIAGRVSTIDAAPYAPARTHATQAER